MTELEKELIAICDAFRIPGTFYSYEIITQGNINTTYKVSHRWEDGTVKKHMLQKVNQYVFHQPKEIMMNIENVTSHLRAKVTEKPSLHFHHNIYDGTNFYQKTDDSFWRLFNYIDSVTYDTCDDLRVLREAGAGFGEFQMQLADFDASILYETIPNFHNTKKRLETLFRHVEEDPCGRVAEVKKELDYIASVRDEASKLTEMLDAGLLPLRVTHNDTKTNNVLFHRKTKKCLTVIDLDTVMPGLAMHDFGDAVRFAASTAKEDEPNIERVALDLDKFRAFAEGFIGATATALTKTEIETMALGAFCITIELASRFLDDYLTGDKYFKVNYAGHNLVRTRCQLALAQDMQRKMTEMNEIVAEIAAAARANA